MCLIFGSLEKRKQERVGETQGGERVLSDSGLRQDSFSSGTLSSCNLFAFYTQGTLIQGLEGHYLAGAELVLFGSGGWKSHLSFTVMSPSGLLLPLDPRAGLVLGPLVVLNTRFKTVNK